MVERKAGKTEVKEKSERFPWEIRDALEGLSGEVEQAVMVVLMNSDEGLTFDEIHKELGGENELSESKLGNALWKLDRGGLILTKMYEFTPEKGIISTYYEVSEYGVRFVDCLFDSLGLEGNNFP